MRVVTIGQVLEHVEEFEDLLEEFYDVHSHENPHEGVRLLTDYMSRHSHHIRSFLNDIPLDQRNHLLTFPISYEPHVPGCHCFEEIDLSPDADASHVLDAAVLLDECLVQLYRQILHHPVEQHVKEFFEGMIRTLEKDEVQLKKIKAMDYF